MNKTMNHLDIIETMRAKGFVVYESRKRDFNLNIVGIRYPDSRPDYFDDQMLVFWYGVDGGLTFKKWPITTLPGLPFLLKPMNPDGTAILVPGQYVQAFKIGLHKKSYEALVQKKPVFVYRDSNKDPQFDYQPETIQRGMFGINIHKAGILTRLVGPNSAGCQVFQRAEDFKEFMGLCSRASQRWGNSFTYTLLEG